MAIPLFLRDDAWLGSGLTLSLSINLLSPALLGDKLRVVATTKAGGKRTATIQGEVRCVLFGTLSSSSPDALSIRFKYVDAYRSEQLWSPRGLVATCTHIKMVPQKGAASKVLSSAA